MKRLSFAIAALALTATGALAQGVYIGDRGVGVDLGGRRGERIDRRGDRDVYETNSTCRTVTIRSEDDYGNVRRRQERRCD